MWGLVRSGLIAKDMTNLSPLHGDNIFRKKNISCEWLFFSCALVQLICSSPGYKSLVVHLGIVDIGNMLLSD